MLQKRFGLNQILTGIATLYVLAVPTFAMNILSSNHVQTPLAAIHQKDTLPLQVETKYLVGGTKQVPVYTAPS